MLLALWNMCCLMGDEQLSTLVVVHCQIFPNIHLFAFYRQAV